MRAPEPARATLAGERLSHDVSAVPGGLETRFEVAIHTWAGRGMVHVHAGAESARVPLDVQPHPGKLGRDEFRDMLDALSDVSKDLPWGLAPGAHGASRDERSPPVVHPSVLEAELPELLAALRQLQTDPLRWSERLRVIDKLPANRRIDPGSFRWLVTHPRTLAVVRPSPPQSERGSTTERVSLEQLRIESSLHHPATRYLRFLLERLLRALSQTAWRFEEVSQNRAEGFRDELAQARARECLELVNHARSEIERCLRRPPLRDVPPLSPTAAALQAIIDHPVYARIQRLARRLIDPGLRLDDEGSIEASLRRTFDLFELLTLHRLGRELARALGPGWTWRSGRLRTGGLLSGPEHGMALLGRSAHGFSVELLFQQKFSSWSDEPERFQSLSGERRPDFVLLMKEGERALHWLVLDAKYRSSRSAIHEGLADLHMYRDALRWEGMPARAGFILVPRLASDADCYATPEYHQSHRFGALPLRSDGWFRPILTEVLAAVGQMPPPVSTAVDARGSAA
ncbi:MAG TPA: DUF2357 domain-containing protein [Myxococcaceae bacterium]|nr:DUF2357 domain-containing protein [Myxococcaceae bacterium]